MLYNPNWHKKRTRVVSRDGLIAWLLTKDPNEEYFFYNCSSCLFAQYLMARGAKREDLATAFDMAWSRLHNQFWKVARGDGAGTWTFGAALQRVMEMSCAQATSF